MPFIAQGFSDPNARIFQRARKEWSAMQRKDKQLRGSSNGIIGGYHKWLKARTQELDWLPKLKVSSEEEVETPKESDVTPCGACRPKIFFINGFLCFLEDEWQQNGEGRERGDANSRRR